MPRTIHGLFHPHSRLRSRVKRIKDGVSRLASFTQEKDLKFQLKQARDLLFQAADMMTPAPEHTDQPLRLAEAVSAPAAATAQSKSAALVGVWAPASASPQRPLGGHHG